MNGFDFILAGTLAAATPMLLAALGELVVERSGVLNLGLEGLMAVGAALAFITVYSYDSHVMGFAVAAFGGAALSMVFAAVVLGFAANQVAAAVALLDEGATVPFIARYRKEVTGELDEVLVLAIRDRLEQMKAMVADLLRAPEAWPTSALVDAAQARPRHRR